jgi:CheY-like chemotaxis protein
VELRIELQMSFLDSDVSEEAIAKPREFLTLFARFCEQPAILSRIFGDRWYLLSSQPMPRILVVDDDDAYRSVIEDSLSGDYQIVSTGNPEKAVLMAVDEEPDIILLDLAMPTISGFELCQTLSSLSLTQHIPIFIVTGFDERNKGFCQNLGASRYYTKPVDFAKLKADVASTLALKKSERRRDIRVLVKLSVTLRGQAKNGDSFEVRATTENVSKSGFLCVCQSPISGGASVEVFLGEHERPLGHARLVRIAPIEGPMQRYGFQFTGLWSAPLVNAGGI